MQLVDRGMDESVDKMTRRRTIDHAIVVVWIAHATLLLAWVFLFAFVTSRTQLGAFYGNFDKSSAGIFISIAVVWVTIFVIVLLLNHRYARSETEHGAAYLTKRVAECAAGVLLITVTGLPLITGIGAFILDEQSGREVYDQWGQLLQQYFVYGGLASGPIATICFIISRELTRRAERVDPKRTSSDS